MPITLKQLLAISKDGVSSGASGQNPYAEGDQTRQTAKLQDYLKGQTEGRRQQQAKEMLNDPKIQDNLNNGGSYSVDPETGKVTIGGNPYAKLGTVGPNEALKFQKVAKDSFKGINDQLDASKATIDNLNLGNDTGDRLALLNEAKLALAGSGGRAFGQVMSTLSGDPTMASNAQKAYNWLQNTPNISKMPPAQRDAIRESVYSRLDQVEQLGTQAAAQLAQMGPALAPHADYNSILQSYVAPSTQKLQSLRAMQKDYQSQRGNMSAPPVSQPSTANQNPTTLDRLRGAFGALTGNQQQQTPQQQAPAGPPVDEQAEFIKKFMAARQAAKQQAPNGQQQ